jgi:quinol monooxygenase YgiN
MTAPFIFVATYRIKEGKLEDYEKLWRGLVEFVQANEPRLLAFNTYVDEDGTEATTIQVHPDADSMEFHMKVAGARILEGYPLLETVESINVFGTPTEGFLAMTTQMAGPGVAVNVKPRHLGGFTRLAAG